MAGLQPEPDAPQEARRQEPAAPRSFRNNGVRRFGFVSADHAQKQEQRHPQGGDVDESVMIDVEDAETPQDGRKRRQR